MRPRHVAWALALACIPSIVLAGRRDELSFSTRIDQDKPSITCADIDMRFGRDSERAGGIVTVCRDQTISLSTGGSTGLRVRASNRGGVRVQSSAGGGASALICMAAGATSQAEGNAILDQLHVRNEGGELTVTGPEHAEWAAYVVVSLPGDAKLDLSAENGELALHGVSGQFTLRTTNGPITVADAAGQVDAETVNGPIQFRGHSGDIRLAAENGPVDVKLDVPTWTGKGLDASTSNGPVQLRAPADLKTGVQVRGSAHSPFSLEHLDASNFDDWSRDHSVRLGEGPVLVRLSTVNGPVQILGPNGFSKESLKGPSKGSSKEKSKGVRI